MLIEFARTEQHAASNLSGKALQETSGKGDVSVCEKKGVTGVFSRQY